MKNKLNDEQKLNILLTVLQEKYNSLHIIRERVQNICLWILGILLGAGGWIIQSDIILFNKEKILFLIGAIVSFVVLRFLYLSDLEKGFKSQQIVTVHLEKTLGLFDSNIFDETGESMYPKSWEKAGSKDTKGNFFFTSYLLLYIGFIFLFVSILMNGCIF
ncbi:MAG: hypothetical protein WC884_04170 [Candidatus Paceibacterota bacterium]